MFHRKKSELLPLGFCIGSSVLKKMHAYVFFGFPSANICNQIGNTSHWEIFSDTIRLGNYVMDRRALMFPDINTVNIGC